MPLRIRQRRRPWTTDNKTNGIMVVNAVNGGTRQKRAHSHSMGAKWRDPTNTELFRGEFYRVSVTKLVPFAPNRHLLHRHPVPPSVLPDSPAPPSPPEPVKPLYRPDAAAYLANQRLAGQMFVHSLHECGLGEPQARRRPLFQSGRGQGPSRLAGGSSENGEGSRSAGRNNSCKFSTDSFLLHGWRGTCQVEIAG